MEGGTGDQNIE